MSSWLGPDTRHVEVPTIGVYIMRKALTRLATVIVLAVAPAAALPVTQASAKSSSTTASAPAGGHHKGGGPVGSPDPWGG